MNKNLWLEIFKTLLAGQSEHFRAAEGRQELLLTASLLADDAVKLIEEKFGEDYFLTSKEQELCQTIDALEKELKKK